ncbi:MAG TPA: HipA family kinase [Polyangiaceae bacterium]
MALNRFVATRVERRLLGGNSSPVVVETGAGRFVLKLRGAGHGVLALVAEVIVADLAERLGLAVPARALVELRAGVPSDDKNDELADLLQRSAGQNLGFRLLDGARAPTARDLEALSDDFVARALFLDGLTMNPDRTPSNPNILLWKGQPWLIDHGSALPFHHDWSSVTEDSPRERTGFATHVFQKRASLLGRYDAELTQRLDRRALAAAAAAVPDEFLAHVDARMPPRFTRSAYDAFLWKRLKPPRPFVP